MAYMNRALSSRDGFQNSRMYASNGQLQPNNMDRGFEFKQPFPVKHIKKPLPSINEQCQNGNGLESIDLKVKLAKKFWELLERQAACLVPEEIEYYFYKYYWDIKTLIKEKAVTKQGPSSFVDCGSTYSDVNSISSNRYVIPSSRRTNVTSFQSNIMDHRPDFGYGDNRFFRNDNVNNGDYEALLEECKNLRRLVSINEAVPNQRFVQHNGGNIENDNIFMRPNAMPRKTTGQTRTARFHQPQVRNNRQNTIQTEYNGNNTVDLNDSVAYRTRRGVKQQTEIPNGFFGNGEIPKNTGGGHNEDNYEQLYHKMRTNSQVGKINSSRSVKPKKPNTTLRGVSENGKISKNAVNKKIQNIQTSKRKTAATARTKIQKQIKENDTTNSSGGNESRAQNVPKRGRAKKINRPITPTDDASSLQIHGSSNSGFNASSTPYTNPQVTLKDFRNLKEKPSKSVSTDDVVANGNNLYVDNDDSGCSDFSDLAMF